MSLAIKLVFRQLMPISLH